MGARLFFTWDIFDGAGVDGVCFWVKFTYFLCSNVLIFPMCVRSSSFREKFMFSAHFLTIDVHCASFFGHTENVF